MKLARLAPLKGKQAVEFMMKFGSIMDSEIEMLPCGCITLTKQEPTPLIVYIHICPMHIILEHINMECNKRVWSGALFKPFKYEV